MTASLHGYHRRRKKSEIVPRDEHVWGVREYCITIIRFTCLYQSRSSMVRHVSDTVAGWIDRVVLTVIIFVIG